MPEYNPVVENLDPPWEAIAADRATCPVAHVAVPEQEFFQITRYDLITEVLRNHKVFSNIHGTTVSVGSYSEEEQVLSFADPPRHTKQRRLLVSAFSPARVDAIGPHIQDVADDLIDQLPADGGSFELTKTFGAPLPVQIICEMLGVPMDDRDDFRRWSEISERAASMSDRDAYKTDLEAFSAYLADLVSQRQAVLDAGDHRDDLITAIMTAEVDGERFTPTEVVAIIRLLLSAGNTTTTTLIGNLVKAIEEHPAEKAKLLADLEGLSMSAVDEGMRYDGPIHGLFRAALVDTEVGGVPIPAGCRVFNLYGAGSHDPAVFDRADEFVVDRDWEQLRVTSDSVWASTTASAPTSHERKRASRSRRSTAGCPTFESPTALRLSSFRARSSAPTASCNSNTTAPSHPGRTDEHQPRRAETVRE